MAASGSNRPLRADAARNIDRIISSARECFHEYGPEVPLQVIARHAGVGPATLFRNFADKEELVLAALAQQLRLRVDPLAARALERKDSGEGMLEVVAALLEAASENRNLLLAIGRRRRELLGGAGRPMVEALQALLLRGQEQGRIRPDISAYDVVPLLAMALGALEAAAPGSDAWRRHLALLGDALLVPAAARTLPVPAAPPAAEGLATPDTATRATATPGVPPDVAPESGASDTRFPDTGSAAPAAQGSGREGPATPEIGLFSSLAAEPGGFSSGPSTAPGPRWNRSFLASAPTQQAQPGRSSSPAQHNHQERRAQP
ncbi:MAG: TetR/AcrR family transcriptional regulator [Micrococcaceae bacterium]|nr:TetR/AcrR family transcriptional regulator [Micrococcaceae bacterium]